HEDGRPVRRRPNDLERLPQCRQLCTAPRSVVGHKEVLAVEEEVDLDPRDAFGIALAKAGERVLPVTTAPGSSMRLELHDVSMSCARATRSPLRAARSAGMKFIGGEPMKPATKRFTGCA